MRAGTKAELLFEEFLSFNDLKFERLMEGVHRTPNYKVILPGKLLVVEVSSVVSRLARGPSQVRSKTMKDAVRTKIKDKSSQLRWAEAKSLPSLLLLSEEEDEFGFSFLEDMDFMTAMYGQMTIEMG